MASIEDKINKANELFETGEITKTAELLATVRKQDVPQNLLAKFYFLFLGAGLYGKGDADEIRQVNRSIQTDFHPSMRYRLALRTGDYAMAKRIRSQENLPFDVTEDFGWSASLKCIWAGKRKMGMRLYHKRMHARNFGRFIPPGVEYVPLGPNDEECGRVFLEQGIGDWLIHLGVMRRFTKREDHLFLGEARSEYFVRKYFPKAEFRPRGHVYKDLEGQTFHGSGDYLAAAFLRDGFFGPTPMDTTRRPGTNPVFGVCWRGGSAQNRREERRIPLYMFLDMLPKGHSYVALQADISEEEKEFLRRDGRVILPNFDIKQSSAALYECISNMAGVISVDSANWHFAGLAQVPIYALMNKTIHWYWGPQARVQDVYPASEVAFKANVKKDELDEWCQGAVDLHGTLKSAYVQRKPDNDVDRPVFVLGAPRSGTSMVTGALAACGLWMGQTIKGNRDNNKGFFENLTVRERILKPILANLGVDPAGVQSFMPIDQLGTDPTLRSQLINVIRAQGYTGRGRWGYKEPKLTLLWPMFADAFPNASWVILERDREAVVKSCLNTGFMAKHSRDEEFWRHFIDRHDDRLSVLERSVSDVTRIKTDALVNSDMKPLKDLIKNLGLKWNQSAVEDFVDPKLFGRHG